MKRAKCALGPLYLPTAPITDYLITRFSRLSSMIIYNVTCKIEESREDEWVKWMRDIHVPEVCAKGAFIGATLLRLRFPLEDEGVTYAIQYRCTSMQILDRYLSEHAPAMQLDHTLTFGADVVAFRTILEVEGEYAPISDFGGRISD